jgi:hypothetical protein
MKPCIAYIYAMSRLGEGKQIDHQHCNRTFISFQMPVALYAWAWRLSYCLATSLPCCSEWCSSWRFDFVSIFGSSGKADHGRVGLRHHANFGARCPLSLDTIQPKYRLPKGVRMSFHYVIYLASHRFSIIVSTHEPIEHYITSVSQMKSQLASYLPCKAPHDDEYMVHTMRVSLTQRPLHARMKHRRIYKTPSQPRIV